MNILHLSETPLSASPYNLMMVQRKAGHNARLIGHKNCYSDGSPVTFPYDILLRNRINSSGESVQDFSRDLVYSLFDSADIIHCHNYYTRMFIFRLYGDLVAKLKKKHVVMQYHSPRSSIPDVEKTLKDPSIAKHLVVAQYQTRQFPEATPVPNAFDIDDDLHRSIPKHPVTKIAYSPSNIRLKGWNNKGFTETKIALNNLTGNFGYKIITGVPYESCLRTKQECSIAIDEVMTGSYHVCSLEALSHGQVAISGMDEHCYREICKYTETDYCPIVSTNSKDLRGVLQTFISYPDSMREIQERSRKFMEEHWSITKLNAHFQKVYND